MQAVSIPWKEKKKKKKQKKRERGGGGGGRRKEEALTLWLSKRSKGYLYAKKSKSGLLTVI